MKIKRVAINLLGLSVDTEKSNREVSDKNSKNKKISNKIIIPVDYNDDRSKDESKRSLDDESVPKSKSNSISKIDINYTKNFTIDLEKIYNLGEDAPTLLMQFRDNSIVLGIADGMGGAGATVYDIEDTRRSGAYLASHLIISIAAEYFINLKNEGYNIKNDEVAKELKYHFDNGLLQVLDKIEKRGNLKSNIKSNLIKRLPTTFALAHINESGEKIKISVFWAGDSRIYALNSLLGLHQLTLDDLVSQGDAFDNLYNDSKIANCINADTQYRLNTAELSLDSPQIIIATSDGAFGNRQTPVHFEFLLLNTMMNSDSMENWKKSLTEEFSKIQNDDISFALSIVGFFDFLQLRSQFKDRYREVLKDINNVDGVFYQINSLTTSLDEIKEKNNFVRREISRLEDQLKFADEKLNHLERKINSAEYDIKSSVNQIEKKKREIELLNQRILELENDIRESENENESIEMEKKQVKATLDEFLGKNYLIDERSITDKLKSEKIDLEESNRTLWKKYKREYEKYIKKENQ